MSQSEKSGSHTATIPDRKVKHPPGEPRVHKIQVDISAKRCAGRYVSSALEDLGVEDVHIQHGRWREGLTFYRRATTFIEALSSVVAELAQTDAEVVSIYGLSSSYDWDAEATEADEDTP